MNSNERRERIYALLQEGNGSITASELAEKFGVTRQIIVSDIAILRANGKKITAARNGYMLEHAGGQIESVICRHSINRVSDEFNAIVDNGGTVVDVMVEHPIYGQISADLHIASRYDAEQFMQKVRESGASQLCDLTGGLHIHMLRVPDSETYARIVAALSSLGILAEK